MKRAIAKWIISHSADSGRPLPAWVKSSMRRDPSLAEYHSRVNALVRDLRNQADAWVNHSVSDRREPRSDRWFDQASPVTAAKNAAYFLPRYTWLASAAIVSLAIGWWIVFNREHETKSGSPDFSGKGQVEVRALTSADLRPILAAASAAEEVVHKLSLGTQVFVSRLASSSNLLEIEKQLARAEEASARLTNSSRQLKKTIAQLATKLLEQTSTSSSLPPTSVNKTD